ncbi:hypothetical protein BC826DRAFT_1106158 [Russula brevipes]|nr:hypothetical protein BC826DRAFT_1113349 [Russula brevipes]KAI0290998.1 hypothetical protein BC826DRAFT_1106158 [Russula brevipes]
MSPPDLTNPSPQLGAVLQWHKAATAWEFDVLEALLSDDYTYKIHPASANKQPKNKGEAVAYAKFVGALFGYKPLKYEILQFSEHAGTIWVHSRVYGDGPGGLPTHEFSYESIFIFTVSSGDDIKITAIQDFVDTKLNAELTAAAAASATAQK